MGMCKDPRLTYLNDKGYNVLILPRQGIEPLDVVGRDKKSVEKLGALPQIWRSTAPTPAPKPADAAVDLSGTSTQEIKLSIGVEILATILKGMGAATPKLDFAYKRARSVKFQFAHVKVVGIDPLLIGDYLSQGDLNQGNPFARYFRGEEAEAFVISEVLKSDSVVVEAAADSGTDLKLDLQAIQNAVGASVGVAPVGSSTQKAEYKTADGRLLTFGFKLYCITFVDGNWTVHGLAPSGATAFVSAAESPVLLLEEELAALLA
jgi:hypothetical protein